MMCQVCESRPAAWRIICHLADGISGGDVCESCGIRHHVYAARIASRSVANADELMLIDGDIPPVIQNCPQCYGAPIGECPFCGTRCIR
jgi:protein-arginine kinase activator protein McsA